VERRDWFRECFFVEAASLERVSTWSALLLPCRAARGGCAIMELEEVGLADGETRRARGFFSWPLMMAVMFGGVVSCLVEL